MQRRPTLLIVKLALSCISLLLSVVAAEAVARMLEPRLGGAQALSSSDEQTAGPAPTQKDFVLGDLVQGVSTDTVYRLRPNLNGTFRGVGLSTNSHGLRDKETPVKKPSGTVRVVALGDSVLFGWGVELEQRYTTLLERDLTADCGTPVEFINTGVPGFNTAQQVSLLEEIGLQFAPDLLLIQIIPNDLELPQFLLPKRSWHPRDWALVARARNLLGLPPLPRLRPHNLQHLSDEQQHQVLHRYAHLQGADAFTGALERLSTIAAARNLPVVMLVETSQGHPWQLATSTAQRLAFTVVESKPVLQDTLRAKGLEPTEANLREHIWVTNDDQHPGPLGHAVYTKALSEPIQQLLCPQ